MGVEDGSVGHSMVAFLESRRAPKAPKTNANFMEVSLNSLDLYDITFAKLTKMGEMKSVKTYDNVYNDMLVRIFESHTGMYTTL